MGVHTQRWNALLRAAAASQAPSSASPSRQDDVQPQPALGALGRTSFLLATSNDCWR